MSPTSHPLKTTPIDPISYDQSTKTGPCCPPVTEPFKRTKGHIPSPQQQHQEDEQELPFSTVFLTIYSYTVGFFFALVHNFLLNKFVDLPENPGYEPLTDKMTKFYMRYLYGRLSDCWNRPIVGVPGAWIDVSERAGSIASQSLRMTGNVRRVLNLGSYNYLGFAEPHSPTNQCSAATIASLASHSVSTCSSLLMGGHHSVHKQLAATVASFVGKEDALLFGMGYATNSTSLHAFVGKGGLLISDSLNHASIIVGAKCGQAKVMVFKHNDHKDLERVLRKAIFEGQPQTGRPWSKIMIVVEGIYSMEGEILCLNEIIALKKKYKAYLYVDEAHSIGALGPRGRGVCDYFGVDPADVDILMGTFTKSFSGAGGYIAASKEIINYLRAASFSTVQDTSIAIPVATQILTSMRIIAGMDGTDEGKTRLDKLRDNSNYFRRRMQEEGFSVMGSHDSPVVPILVGNPNKLSLFSRACLQHGIGTVIVSFPATPVLGARVRFCISSSHTTEDLEDAIRKMSEIGEMSVMNTPSGKYKNRLACQQGIKMLQEGAVEFYLS